MNKCKSIILLLTRFTTISFQQWRLIPKLAATYALAYFARTFFMNFVELQVGMMMGETGEAQVSFDFQDTIKCVMS